ncbi:hypothetical protein EMPS_05459 [Entomortierella parvispora]|uniref:Uncharacterized protein n=1 Tax=Entomortierella parvispora TaxID=205924 RepID=A0A9P3HAC2_9FUNG|nr:hypothetical protein EMPS_05459 [Entomortierella parvispora]
MAATTPQAWSSLFYDSPSASTTQHLYTEEAIQNDSLTAYQVIEKADSNSSLLIEMVSALNLDNETLLSFGDNDLIQTLHRECQEMADYLSARIWHDSGNLSTSNHSNGAASSSSSSSYPGQYGKAVAEEARIAAFISSSEKIQYAFKKFEETRDFLQARELQQEEEDKIRVLPHRFLDDVDDYAQNTSALDEEDNDLDVRGYLHRDDMVNFSRARVDVHREHSLKSEEPLVWKLDPREDFKVNQTKMKKKVDQATIDRIYKERLLEKSPLNSTHGLTAPKTITPDMLADDEENVEAEMATMDGLDQYQLPAGGAGPSQAAAEEVKAAEETKVLENEEEEEILEGVERINNHALFPDPVQDDTDDEEEEKENAEEDEAGILSDDSWEEIPRHMSPVSGIKGVTQRLDQLLVDDDEAPTSTVSSSTSSFLLTTDAATTPNFNAISST